MKGEDFNLSLSLKSRKFKKLFVSPFPLAHLINHN